MENIIEIEKPERNKCINNGSSNVIGRVSLRFARKIKRINKKRNEDNLNRLSYPKITELIVRHKYWEYIENDIIRFLLDEEESDYE